LARFRAVLRRRDKTFCANIAAPVADDLDLFAGNSQDFQLANHRACPEYLSRNPVAVMAVLPRKSSRMSARLVGGHTAIEVGTPTETLRMERSGTIRDEQDGTYG
jgi:hypothetical protein